MSLDGYVRATRTEGASFQMWPVCGLPVVALGLHPYLAAMCGVFLVATLVAASRNRVITPLAALRFLAFTVAGAAAIVMVGGGYLLAASHNFGDYGVYSLNLLSPIVPFANTLSGKLLGTTTPSIPGIYQWEGGCYLGAGLLLLVVATLPAVAQWRASLRKHAVLAVLLVVTLIFAISNRVGFGAYEIVSIPLPRWLLDTLSLFRGSGRFVWISAYVLAIFTIAVVARHYRPKTATIILCSAALLQLIDVLPMQRDVRIASMHGPTSTIQSSVWTDLIAQHSSVFEFPSFECGGIYNAEIPGGRWRALEIDWIIAKLGKPNNSAYLARYTKDCERERREAANPLKADTLYIYRSSEEIGEYLTRNGVLSNRCGYLDDAVICSLGSDLSKFR